MSGGGLIEDGSCVGVQVPATMDEALTTGLISLFEKRRFRNFLSYLSKYEEGDPKTYGGERAGRFGTRRGEGGEEGRGRGGGGSLMRGADGLCLVMTCRQATTCSP